MIRVVPRVTRYSSASTTWKAAPFPIETAQSAPTPSPTRPPAIDDSSEPLCEMMETAPTARSAGSGIESGHRPDRKSANPRPFGPYSRVWVPATIPASSCCRASPSAVPRSAKPSAMATTCGIPSATDVRVSSRVSFTPVARITASGTAGRSWREGTVAIPSTSRRERLTGQIAPGYPQPGRFAFRRFVHRLPLRAPTIATPVPFTLPPVLPLPHRLHIGC
jgi:hypothetical protein